MICDDGPAELPQIADSPRQRVADPLLFRRTADHRRPRRGHDSAASSRVRCPGALTGTPLIPVSVMGKERRAVHQHRTYVGKARQVEDGSRVSISPRSTAVHPAASAGQLRETPRNATENQQRPPEGGTPGGSPRSPPGTPARRRTGATRAVDPQLIEDAGRCREQSASNTRMRTRAACPRALVACGRRAPRRRPA